MDYADTESVMNLVLLNPVPAYPGLAQFSPVEQPPPAYEDPPSYASVVGHPMGMTMGMTTQIVPAQANQQADAGAFGRIRKAYTRTKKWVAHRFRRWETDPESITYPEPLEKSAASDQIFNSLLTSATLSPSPGSNFPAHVRTKAVTPTPLEPTNATLHSPSRQSTQSNPFSDSHSIQTAGTESTNVIPIALVSPEHRSTSDTVPTTSTGPVRPSRSPDLNLEHVNVSRDSIRPGNNLSAPSTRSGVSAVSSRNSYMSNASFASDFLNEAPIITPVKGSVRVVKAEVISTGSLSPVTAEGPRPMSRPPAKSPLASQSFGPAHIVKEEDEHPTDPFQDGTSSPTASVTTFGHASGMHASIAFSPTLPWLRDGSRPSSMGTQAGSVVDIGSATQVNVGLATPLTGGGFPRSPFRTTMGRVRWLSTTTSSPVLFSLVNWFT
ncbi:hypothetical protein B0H12DRAFT_1231040 [Mycena haematopus]|nr:hypothetical protein B0H12DRAFT_1231040 [Mycena haematopus]